MYLSYWCGCSYVPSATASPLSFFCLRFSTDLFVERQRDKSFLFIPFPNYLKTIFQSNGGISMLELWPETAQPNRSFDAPRRAASFSVRLSLLCCSGVVYSSYSYGLINLQFVQFGSELHFETGFRVHSGYMGSLRYVNVSGIFRGFFCFLCNQRSVMYELIKFKELSSCNLRHKPEKSIERWIKRSQRFLQWFDRFRAAMVGIDFDSRTKILSQLKEKYKSDSLCISLDYIT